VAAQARAAFDDVIVETVESIAFNQDRMLSCSVLISSGGAALGRLEGWPAHVLMFKVLILQVSYGLSDERSECLIRDRLSFMRFLRLRLADTVPDANTIWTFREALTRAKLRANRRPSWARAYEAARDSAKLGAQSIINWVKAHHEQVEIAVTKSYLNFDTVRSVNPNTYEPNLGERASMEVIEEPTRLRGDEKAVLLCEETMVTRRVVVRERERIIELSTMDFLKLLEAEQRIQSADAVFDRALAAGRTSS
jgi:hypothetical protein